ncbi:MAG: ArsR family transcriptional regulator [Methanomicrobiaceae archaeon]|nr:ArsR family transcriptional regulator [Methanomicrobiaceae archaeon]
MNGAEQKTGIPNALIFSKNGRTIVIDSPVKIEILRMVMEGEQRFDVIVKRLKKAKSTVSIHLHDLIDSGIIAERADEKDARRKYLYLDANNLGTISPSEESLISNNKYENAPFLSDPVRPASVFRLIFNTIRTSLLSSGVNVEPVLFNAGVKAGEEVAEIISESSYDKFLDNLYDFFLSNELGEITVESREPLIITVKNCYECQDLPKIGRPACSFDSGFLTAVFRNQTGGDVVVEETHCYAQGDPFCRFVIKRETKDQIR